MLQSLNISKKGFFGKFYLNDFLLLIVPCHPAKFKKNPSSRSSDMSLHKCGPQLGQNCPFGSNEDFFGNFSWIIFNHSLHPLMLQSLKKKMHNFESQLDQNCSFGQVSNFWGYFSLVIFLYLPCCKVRKQTFVGILWYKLA